jgi:hypothetical protein
VKRLLISEAVGRLASALAHGDIRSGPVALPILMPWQLPQLTAGQRRMLGRKRPQPKPWKPRIFFFEEPDLPMLPAEARLILPVIERQHTTTQEEIDRILAKLEYERQMETALRLAVEKLHAAELQLVRLKAEIARTT